VSDPKVEAVQRLYEAFGKGDVEVVMVRGTDDTALQAELPTP